MTIHSADGEDVFVNFREKAPAAATPDMWQLDAEATDIIAGFPQETDEDFEETLNTVREIGFTHIHAFPYSIREGTPAATMPDQVPEAVKKTRVALLRCV